MIENYQKMFGMSQRVEKLINGEKMQLKMEPISDEEENWADNSLLSPFLQPLRIGIQSQTIHPSM